MHARLVSIRLAEELTPAWTTSKGSHNCGICTLAQARYLVGVGGPANAVLHKASHLSAMSGSVGQRQSWFPFLAGYQS